jgi:hypothetical protein
MTPMSTIPTAPYRIQIEEELHIPQELEKTYPELKFQVPSNAEKLEISYSYSKNDSTVIDIGLRSPERLIGWSGGARTSFFVAEATSTPGYLSGPIRSGEWAVMLGAYRIPEGGCKVSVQIVVTLKHTRWLKGELHAHTVHSDGSYLPEQAMALCLERGLDFLSLTDHNTASQNRLAYAGHESLLLIPGVELTSYKGHANLLGQPDSLEDFRVLTREQVVEQLNKARAKGALVSLNHPFCPDCPWEFGFDVPYDAIEVWNGPWRTLNETAVRWWQEQLAAGQRIVAIGGSDVHRTEPYVRHGAPTAYVLANAETTEAVMEGIRSGHVVLSMDTQETFIDMWAGEVRVGGTVIMNPEQEAGAKLEIRVTQARHDKVSLWSDRGCEQEWDVEGEMETTIELAGDRLFYRVEARRYLTEHNREVMTCLTNPIYVVRQGEPS